MVLAAVTAVAVGGSTAACLRAPSGTAVPASAGTATTATATTATAATNGSSGPAPVAPAGGQWSDFRVPAAAWTSWKPVLRHVRPAGEDDVESVARRSRTVLERPFTATVQGPFGEYTLTRSPARSHVRLALQDRPFLDVYADRTALADPDPQRLLVVPLTVCPHAERSCFTITGKEPAGDRPHLFDTLTDSFVYIAAAAMTAQARGPAFLDSVRGHGLVLGTATVESPLGTLACVVVTDDPGTLAALEGEKPSAGGGAADHGELCVDRRGLVVLAPGEALSSATPWTSLRTGASDDSAGYPYPVRPYPS
ncbi:hypothetical protein GCM10027517_07260 [Phycicoccus ginsengisoli]